MKKIEYHKLFMYVLSGNKVQLVYHDAKKGKEEGRIILDEGYLSFVTQYANGYHSVLIDEAFYNMLYHIEVEEDGQ